MLATARPCPSRQGQAGEQAPAGARAAQHVDIALRNSRAKASFGNTRYSIMHPVMAGWTRLLTWMVSTDAVTLASLLQAAQNLHRQGNHQPLKPTSMLSIEPTEKVRTRNIEQICYCRGQLSCFQPVAVPLAPMWTVADQALSRSPLGQASRMRFSHLRPVQLGDVIGGRTLRWMQKMCGNRDLACQPAACIAGRVPRHLETCQFCILPACMPACLPMENSHPQERVSPCKGATQPC